MENFFNFSKIYTIFFGRLYTFRKFLHQQRKLLYFCISIICVMFMCKCNKETPENSLRPSLRRVLDASYAVYLANPAMFWPSKPWWYYKEFFKKSNSWNFSECAVTAPHLVGGRWKERQNRCRNSVLDEAGLWQTYYFRWGSDERIWLHSCIRS